MLPNSNATTIAVNTRCRCKICYAILRTPVSGKSSQYYNVNSNPRSAAFTTALDQQSSSELLTTAFKEDYVEDCRYTSDMSDNSSAATATSFTDLMERFLRVSVDATAAATTLQNSSSLNSQVNTVLNSTAAAKSTAGRVSSHSEIICSKCSNILSKISELHLALQTLASNLREKYRKTLRIVGHASAASSSRQELNKCLHHHYPLGCVAVGSSSHPQPSNRSFSQPLPLCSGAYNTEQHSSDGDAADVKCTPEDVPNSYLALEDGQDDCLLAPQQSSTDDVVHSPVSWSPEGRSVQSSMINDGKCNGTADNKLKPSIQQLSDSQMIGSRLISSSFSSRSIRHSKRKGKPRHHIMFCERKLSLNETCKVRSSVSSYKTTNQQQQNSSSANNCKNHHLLHDQYTLVNSNGQYNNDGSCNQEVSSTKKRLISYDRHQHHHHQHHMLDDHPEHSGNRHELFNDDESTNLINDGNSSSQLRTMQQHINSRNNAAANRCRDFTAMSYSGACTTASDRNYSKNEYHSQHRLTQEEDEEKELQPRARNQPVCTDAKYNIQHNDNGNGRRININKNHTSNTRSVRKAKANNVDRIAASLMADCNSNDSMELEGNNSPISEDSPSHLHHSDSMGGVNLILDDNSQIHNEKREKCDLQGESSFEIISNKRIRLPDILDHRTKSTQIYDFNQSETNDEDISLKYNQIRNSRHEELYRFGNRLDRSSKVEEDEDGEGDNVAFSSISEHDHELYPCNVLLNDSAVTFSSGSGRHRSKISGTTSIKHEYPSNHSADNVASLKAAEMNTAERNFHLDYNCSPGGGATYINEENRSIKGGCSSGDISIMSQDRTMMGQLRAVTTTTSTAAITGKNIVDHSLQQSSVGSMMPATKTQPNSPIYQSHPAQITQRNPVALTSTATSTTTSVPNTQFHSRQLGNFKRYECGYCGKIVTNIQIHVRRHTNEKPYSCEYCEKRFTNSGDLQIHTRIHTGEKPYRCPLCGKSYRTIGNFNSHVKTHDSGERPHRCILCNETFEQTRDWFSHLRSNHKLSTPVQATISSGGNSTNN